MINTTQFIVFHSIKYRESDLLISAYTASHGRQTFLLPRSRTAKKQGAAARIFPLNILDAEVYYKAKAPIHYIKTLQPAIGLNGLRSNLYKSSIALFLGEILYKSIKEEEANLPLYQFLKESIQTLNDLTCSVANFHLYFLVQLCGHLGYAPLLNYHPEKTPLFDMAQGAFVASGTRSDFLFSKEESLLLSQLSGLTEASEAAHLPLNGAQRHQCVMRIIHYLHYHLGFSLDIKSPDVLRQLFQ